MSLMLDALRRIEARQASARAVASVAVATEAGSSIVATAEPIEVPPELTADRLSDLAPEDIALSGAVSMDTAMNELLELLAEARLLDQPPAAPEPADVSFAQEEPFGENENDIGEKTGLPSTPAPQLPLGDVMGCSSVDLSFLDEEAGKVDDTALSQHLEDLAEAGTASAAPAFALAAPPPVMPLGSDPYAATAWQIVQQFSGNVGGPVFSNQRPASSARIESVARSRLLMFTSPGDGHGKTMTLVRLLPHLARIFSGRILVVDANTRNPDLARWLEVAATWRLTDVLAGATHWMNAVRPTSWPRVSLLPGGTDPARRNNALAAARLLREFAGHYDLVLVDAVSLAHDGASQLAAACDGSYLIVRMGEGSRRTTRDAARVIDNAGGRLLGCIVIDGGA
jgi:Mrp family chromosome partitioning ATPase